MSKIRANFISSKNDNRAVEFTKGIVVGGAVTATNFDFNAEIYNVGTGASIGNPTDNVLTLGTNNVERLRITSGGVVGINKISPSSQAQLDVVGSSYWPILVKTTSTGGGGVAIKDKDDVTSLYTGTGGSSWLTGSVITDGLIRAQNNLLFATNGNNESFRITSGGEVQIAGGNLKFSTTGTGIDFSAVGGPTNGTSTNELLEDYEEGTFTPIFIGGVSGTEADPLTYTAQVGHYTKVGRLVHFTFQLAAGGSGVNSSGHVIISGLPYNCSSVPQVGGAYFVYSDNIGNSNDVNVPQLYMGGNVDRVYFYQGANNWNGNTGKGINNTNMYIGGSYHTDF